MRHTVVGNIFRAIGWLQNCHFGSRKTVLFSCYKRKKVGREGGGGS